MQYEKIAALVREAGAKEVHMRISSPPFVDPCYYGTDIDSRENLIACHHTVDEIAQIIGADTLGYLSLEHAYQLAEVEGCPLHTHCAACFGGGYPTEVPKDMGKDRFENPISFK